MRRGLFNNREALGYALAGEKTLKGITVLESDVWRLLVTILDGHHPVIDIRQRNKFHFYQRR